MTATAQTARTALVTGATSGIGIAIAKRLAADGLTVVVSGRSTERGASVARELGTNVHFLRADLAQPGAADALIEETLTLTGRLDVLVNNAAVDHVGPLLDVPASEIVETFETNTFGAISCLQAAGRAMRDTGDGGAIINITSRLASIGVPTMSIYSASKGALLALTRAAAVELAPHNIRVNAVAPGMTNTPPFRSSALRSPTTSPPRSPIWPARKRPMSPGSPFPSTADISPSSH